MKILATSLVWFAASWFVYDMSAFMVGLPRQATPLVALAVAGTVGLLLQFASLDRRRIALGVRTHETDLPNFS
jgi:putative exporter of polyketide antibiotics